MPLTDFHARNEASTSTASREAFLPSFQLFEDRYLQSSITLMLTALRSTAYAELRPLVFLSIGGEFDRPRSVKLLLLLRTYLTNLPDAVQILHCTPRRCCVHRERMQAQRPQAILI